MIFQFLRRKDPQRPHQISPDVVRGWPPHMMRDIGLPPWPERPRLPVYPLW